MVETIRIRALGVQFRHGILRDFPTRYEKGGRRIRVGFDVADVLRDGQDEPWTLETIDGGVRVKIGDSDHMLEPG